MKKLTYILIFVFSTLIFAQEKILSMQKVESLYEIEPNKTVGRRIGINPSGDIFATNSSYSDVYLLKNGSNDWLNIGASSITGIYCSSQNSLLIESTTGLYFSNNTENYSLTQILFDTKVFSSAINSSGTIYSGTTDGLYKSDNNGTSWSLTYYYPLKMAIHSDDEMFIEEYNKGLCRSVDLGETWEEINYNLSKDLEINGVEIAMDGTKFVSVKNSGIYKLVGTEWVPFGINYDNLNSIHAGKDGYMYCSYQDYIYRKPVNATSWTKIKSSEGRITTFASNSEKLIAGYTDDLLIFETVDHGTTWTINGQIVYPTVLSILAHNNYVFVGTDKGLFRSTDYGATWEPRQLDFAVNDIQFEGTRICLATDDGLYRSLDAYSAWTKRTAYPASEADKFLYKDSVDYVVGRGNLYKSTNFGANWTAIPENFNSLSDIVKLNDGRIYACDYWPGIWYTDDEVNWTDTGLGSRGNDIESNSIGEVYVNINGAIKKLPFAGAEWSTCLTATFYSLYIDSEDIVFVGATSSIKYSRFGSIWDVIYGTPSDSQVNTIFRGSDGYLYCGTGKGLYKSNEPLIVE